MYFKYSHTGSEIELTAVYHWLFKDKSIGLSVKSQYLIQYSCVLKVEKLQVNWLVLVHLATDYIWNKREIMKKYWYRLLKTTSHTSKSNKITNNQITAALKRMDWTTLKEISHTYIVIPFLHFTTTNCLYQIHIMNLNRKEYLQRVICFISLPSLQFTLPFNVLLICKTFGLSIGSSSEGKGISPVPSTKYTNSPIWNTEPCTYT